ncbi:MAG: tetraacyldisaccharide 4'-kinase [Kiritimatiellae bacterium]|jgi:tetraacyldisaccharide 4'-kinase|nr:tetraacyldisaccharide 4'-kinase [Kiritimatiellia bacterium]
MAQKKEKLEKYIEKLIYNRDEDLHVDFGTRVLLTISRGMSHCFKGIILFRHYLYDQRILRTDFPGCQVISIGNLTVGGTGKTPVVELIAKTLASKNRKIAILSRGYKKKEPAFSEKIINKLTFQEKKTPPRVVSDGKEIFLDYTQSGDEPFMLANNLKGVAVLVDKDRVKSKKHAIKEFDCDTLILDDGFQHLALQHSTEIVLVDTTNPYGNGYMLPRGILREPFSNIKRADYIFLTKSTGDNQYLIDEIRVYNTKAKIIECRHAPRYLENIYTKEIEPLEFLKAKRIIAMSGIASPKGFEKLLENFGALLMAKKRFTDHHRYTQKEITNIINLAEEKGCEAIITTEKDTVRCDHMEQCNTPIYFLRVDIEILKGQEHFDEIIQKTCNFS